MRVLAFVAVTAGAFLLATPDPKAVPATAPEGLATEAGSA
jgi:hypothetical protein